MKPRQPLLFDTLPLPLDWEQDAQRDELIARVVFAAAPYGPFDYRVESTFADRIVAGCRVRVPLGRGDRPMVGYCVELTRRGPRTERLKSVLSLIDSASLVSPSLLTLSRWMAEYYLCPWGLCLEAMVPAGVRDQAGTRSLLRWSLAEGVREQLSQLRLRGKQTAAVNALANSGEPLTTSQLAAAAACTAATLQLLRRKGLLRATYARTSAVITPLPVVAREQPLPLLPDQAKALAVIRAAQDAPESSTILLLGVTGSGKTEVYIQAIEETVRRGRQAIVLVPEISLTPQTRQRFQARFADVAVLHSHLSDAQRHAHWQRIAGGEVAVVVGARSAVFAPTPRLGLIVIDEEHDASFKQDAAPRYHAREVAMQRAALAGVPLVLGSATPSLESWRSALNGDIQLVELTVRATGQRLPAVEVVDLRNEPEVHYGRKGLSRPLEQAVAAALAAGGQVILLLNRRGHSTHIQCPACGFVVQCPDCELPLTLHRQQAVAKCHYCDYERPEPQNCPQCHGTAIRLRGLGTERLEDEVRRRFPHAPVVRMDSDTMQRAGSHERVLQQFRSGEARILLGTQMIAKGLDFPNVTLVGVVNADIALHLADFRAAERTFQLVTQVAGRSGRGPRGGIVLVQTASPEHPAIVAASHHDFRGFAAQELAIRRSLGYPPQTQLVRLLFRGPQARLVHEWAVERIQVLRDAASERLPLRILGPAPCPLARVQGRARFHALLFSVDGPALRELVRNNLLDATPPRDVQFQVDVDPLEML